jgi:hypothetical protein
MKRKSLVVGIGLAMGTSALLSGCYIVPIDPRYPPEPGQSVIIGSPRGSSVALLPPSVPTTLQARLYPLNETAGKMGALTATVVDSLNGHATFTLPEGGDVMRGEATRVATDYPGFGSVHRRIYGDGRMPHGQRGIASAVGAHGSYVNCEYALTAPDRGTGACLFSNGATYQLHFGS